MPPANRPTASSFCVRISCAESSAAFLSALSLALSDLNSMTPDPRLSTISTKILRSSTSRSPGASERIPRTAMTSPCCMMGKQAMDLIPLLEASLFQTSFERFSLSMLRQTATSLNLIARLTMHDLFDASPDNSFLSTSRYP